MIVSEIMTTKLITVTPNDTLSHAANLLRQYQFHHLPVIQASKTRQTWVADSGTRTSPLLLEGVLTSEDIDLAAALGTQNSGDAQYQPWEDRRVAEVMHPVGMCVTPTTSAAAAARLLVERGMHYLPVVEYAFSEKKVDHAEEQDVQVVLVGLLTRSDLLLALARALGAYEPGTDIGLPLPAGDLSPLGQTLLLAKELQIPVRSVLAAPMEERIPRAAMVRLGTIHPAPLLVRLRKANIKYVFADPAADGAAPASSSEQTPVASHS